MSITTDSVLLNASSNPTMNLFCTVDYEQRPLISINYGSLSEKLLCIYLHLITGNVTFIKVIKQINL